MFKLIIFDLDGTVIDSDFMLEVTFLQLYKDFKPGYKPDIERIKTFSGPPMFDTVSAEFPDKDPYQMCEEYEKRSWKNYKKYVHLYPNVIEMLTLLKKNNINFGVVTNKNRVATDFAYKLLGVDKWLTSTVCSDEVKNPKPAPDGIIKLMQEFKNNNKDEVMYVGDSKFDYLTAKNAGVKFGHVSWSPRELPKDAVIDFKIDNYLDFAEEIIYEKK